MKQGMLWVVVAWMLFAGVSAGVSTVHATRIPKLAYRVDELNRTIKARDRLLLAQRVEQRKLAAENVKLAIELTHQREQIATLTKANQAKDREINRLRKKPTVTPSRKQKYPVVHTADNSFEVTWYNDFGYTKSGRFVKKGITVAVDPHVIPLGSWLVLKFPDGHQLIRRADDTGGAVKGHVIDVYDSAPDSVLLQRGRTHGVKVTLLRKDI